VLLRSIGLAINELAKKNNRRAMEAIKALKRDKAAVENVYSKMRRIFNHYEQEGEQQRRQAYEMLKQDFQMRIQQAIQQQGGLPMGAKIDIESQPQFQEEWRRTLAQLDSQYQKLLEEYKREILGIR
jgi:DNA integrity scanning protein DisA with diadenylate cyclase activity